MKRIKKLCMTVTEISMNEKELQAFNRWLYDVITNSCNDNKKENNSNMKA